MCGTQPKKGNEGRGLRQTSISCFFQLPTSIVDRLSNVQSRRNVATFLPVVLSMMVFTNSMFGDFVHDDVAAIVKNPDVTGENRFPELFSNDFWGVPMSSVHSHKSYRPVTVLLFR